MDEEDFEPSGYDNQRLRKKNFAPFFIIIIATGGRLTGQGRRFANFPKKIEFFSFKNISGVPQSSTAFLLENEHFIPGLAYSGFRL